LGAFYWQAFKSGGLRRMHSPQSGRKIEDLGTIKKFSYANRPAKQS
jgi:hypothetical protein